jgi:hypothetical protein
MKTIYCKESFWLCIFYFQHFSTFSQFLRRSFSPFGHFLRSVLYYFWSYSTLSHSTFCLSTFGHSMFGHSTFGHSMFGHSTLVTVSLLHHMVLPLLVLVLSTLHMSHLLVLLLSIHNMILSLSMLCRCYNSQSTTWSFLVAVTTLLSHGPILAILQPTNY